MDRKQKPKAPKSLTCLMIPIIVVPVLLIVGYLIFNSWYNGGISKPVSEDSEVVKVTIEPNSNAVQIGQLLKDKGLIKDLNVWKVYVRLNKPIFIADDFTLNKNMSLKEIVEILQKGQEDEYVWVTFPEGTNTKQMYEILLPIQSSFKEGNFSAVEFSNIVAKPDNYTFSSDVQEFLDKYKPDGKSLEGFLSPNTYGFGLDFSAQQVVEMTVRQLIKDLDGKDLDNGEMDFYKALTLASIVEEEAINESDRETIAGIFNNRLEEGMMLQSDATVNYVTGKKDRRATFADLAIDSPYNTYKYTGLPPTPISNPRTQAILVSLNPIDTDYLYFLHGNDNKPHYGKNYTEHQQNIAKYLD